MFEGVTTYPAIVTLAKGATEADGDLAYLVVEGDPPDDLGRAFLEGARRNAARAASDEALGGSKTRRWRSCATRSRAGRKTLGEVYGAPLYGIKTGLNEAFIIDTLTRDRLGLRGPEIGGLAEAVFARRGRQALAG